MTLIKDADDKTRKGIPLYSGCLAYFPDALLAVAELSRIGNDKHNPGQPLHWSREKSNDHLDTLARHLLDYDKPMMMGGEEVLHMTAVVWRALAKLQLLLEERAKAADVAGVTSRPRTSAYNIGCWELETKDAPVLVAERRIAKGPRRLQYDAYATNVALKNRGRIYGERSGQVDRRKEAPVLVSERRIAKGPRRGSMYDRCSRDKRYNGGTRKFGDRRIKAD